MALGTEDIKTTIVGNTVGSSSRNVGVLCTVASINKWSRYKPGYFYVGGTADKFIIYQAPRGGGSTDPRGANPETSDDKEGYREGDFRGYNHAAEAPYVDFPSSVITFPFGTGQSSGISGTFYAKEIFFENDGGLYRETSDWVSPITHVLLLDAADNSIEGTALLPAPGDNNVSIPLAAVTLPAGTQVDKTYHLAFGINSTSWAFKLGTNYGAGGIGTVSMLQLQQRQIYAVEFDDSSIGGGDNPPYIAIQGIGTTDNYFSGTNIAVWKFTNLEAFDATTNGIDSELYRNITADWIISGFYGEPAAEYLAKTQSSFASNGAANSVTLPAGGFTRVGGGDNSPNTFGDGDTISLILRNITINF